MTTALSELDLRAAAPAIFTESNGLMSRRYAHIATMDLLEGLAADGWLPVQAQQDRARQRDARYVQHAVVLRRADTLNDLPTVGDSVPTIMLQNSHNGRTQLRLRAGLYRFVCSNGLVIGQDSFSAAIRHSGDAVAEARGFASTIAESTTRLLDVQRLWASIQLTDAQRVNFAIEAASLRYGVGARSFEASDLLAPRRPEDAGNDLWRTFNVLQEGLTQGGVQTNVLTRAGAARTSRAMTAIGPTAELNAALWALAERQAEAVA